MLMRYECNFRGLTAISCCLRREDLPSQLWLSKILLFMIREGGRERGTEREREQK